MSYLVPGILPEDLFALKSDVQLLQDSTDDERDHSGSSRTDPWEHLWTDVGGEG